MEPAKPGSSRVQGPLDLIELALLVLGKFHGSSLPGSRPPRVAHQRYPLPGNVKPVEIGQGAGPM
jgi:hypothetical protein